MRVLLGIRSDVQQFPGGDYIHLLKTKQALEQMGIICEVLIGVTPFPNGIDVVHLFNTTRIHETYLQFKEATKRGLPVVLTPIWHSLREMRRFYAHLYRLPFFPISAYLALKEFFYARRSKLKVCWPAILNFKGLQRTLVEQCDAILPNSYPELRILQTELRATPRASYVIPPGFDRLPISRKPALERRDLLCVGRIEPRKNQLNVIQAFKSLGRNKHRLILYGSLNESHPGYTRHVQKALVPGWIEHRGQVPLAEIYESYSGAKAVVLASYFETCGFSAMEGMSCGAHACVSDSPYTRAFYSDAATYCDPYSVNSMAEGLRSALSRVNTDYTSLLKNYSWEATAKATAEVYRSVAR